MLDWYFESGTLNQLDERGHGSGGPAPFSSQEALGKAADPGMVVPASKFLRNGVKKVLRVSPKLRLKNPSWIFFAHLMYAYT